MYTMCCFSDCDVCWDVSVYGMMVCVHAHIQTQVATVMDYYNRWMEVCILLRPHSHMHTHTHSQKWPTVEMLAAASLEVRH